ncbi:hypothetical protein ACHAW6_005671 [Cyclotella cf. meneghiniana]
MVAVVRSLEALLLPRQAQNNSMPLPDLEDYFSNSTLCILRVVVGVSLGLLTVYRREMSCNREYRPEDDDAWTLGSSGVEGPRGDLVAGIRDCAPSGQEVAQLSDGGVLHDDSRRNTTLIRRRASSSSLPSLCSGPSTSVQQDITKPRSYDDPTEELLESAGFLFSGGPFLAVMLAVVDHLILTVFLTSIASVGTGIITWRRSRVVKREHDVPLAESLEVRVNSALVRDTSGEVGVQQKMNHRIHHVAWNAATEYFTSISSKLDEKDNCSKAFLTESSPSNKRPSRSKSANNITQVSKEQCREIIAIARGYLNISLLPCDAQICIFSFLHPRDLLSFTCTSRKGRRVLDDGVPIAPADEDCHGIREFNTKDAGRVTPSSHNDRDTALLIWKALFHRDYGWILRDWKIGREAFERSMELCKEEGLVQPSDLDGRVTSSMNEAGNSARVLQHLLSSVGGVYNVNAESNIPIHTSMKEFYFTFAESWLNYTIAGCNTTNKCLIGLHGHVFDISSFVDHHPGSTETLLLQAGRDATVFFETMGHSLGARRLALSMCVVINGQCVRWNSLDRGSLECGWSEDTSCSISNSGLIQPSCPTLQLRKGVPGFLIPRKRSKPRSQGGLSRIRERLQREGSLELLKAARWGNSTLGPGRLFGGVHVYYDPFCSKWRWWYTNLNFDAVYTESVD